MCLRVPGFLLSALFSLGLVIGCSQPGQTEVGSSENPAEDTESLDSATASSIGEAKVRPVETGTPKDSGQIVSPGPSHEEESSGGKPSDSVPLDEAESDSDEPGRHRVRIADQLEASDAFSQALHTHGDATDSSPDEGSVADEDDPNAPTLLTKGGKEGSQHPDEPRLDNGRAPNAVPKPPGAIKQSADGATEGGSQNVKLDMGRGPTAKTTPSSVDSVEKPSTDPDAHKRDSRPDTKVEVARPAKGATRPRKKLDDLPASVRSLDKDGDGQIGLYEWPREKISQFTDLDGDKDGFLTPEELHDGAKRAASQRKETPATKKESADARSSEASGGDGVDAGDSGGDREAQVSESNPSTEQEGP